MEKTITLPTQFAEKTTLYLRELNGTQIWRISPDDDSFHYHTFEVIKIAKEHGLMSVLEILEEKENK